MTRRRVWQAAAWFCWVVALLLLLLRPGVDGEGAPTASRCGRVIEEALSGEATECAAKARRRAHGLAAWLLLTSPVTLGYLTRRHDEPPPAE